MWEEYLFREKNKVTRTDYFMAQIALEIRRGNFASKKRLSLKDFLKPVEFVRSGNVSKPRNIAEETRQAKIFFGTLVGVSPGEKHGSRRT